MADDKITAKIESAFGEAEDGVRNDDDHIGHRTRGLWIFDNVIFNLTNLTVFALSVFATYMTNYSQRPGTSRAEMNWFMKRGEGITNGLQKMGLSEEKAKHGNMVLWSFVDGSVVAPFVAMIEHRRNKIGHWIDEKLHTAPKDQSVYRKQPREGWKSVILGRLAAFSIVTPTYFILSAKNRQNKKSLSLNNILFDKTADAIVEHDVAGIPSLLGKRFPRLDVHGLVKTSVFEVFYTTLCTAVLFAVSFLIGKKDREKMERSGKMARLAPTTEKQGAQEQEAVNARSWNDRLGKKSEQSHADRLANAPPGAKSPALGWSG